MLTLVDTFKVAALAVHNFGALGRERGTDGRAAFGTRSIPKLAGVALPKPRRVAREPAACRERNPLLLQEPELLFDDPVGFSRFFADEGCIADTLMSLLNGIWEGFDLRRRRERWLLGPRSSQTPRFLSREREIVLCDCLVVGNGTKPHGEELTIFAGGHHVRNDARNKRRIFFLRVLLVENTVAISSKRCATKDVVGSLAAVGVESIPALVHYGGEEDTGAIISDFHTLITLLRRHPPRVAVHAVPRLVEPGTVLHVFAVAHLEAFVDSS